MSNYEIERKEILQHLDDYVKSNTTDELNITMKLNNIQRKRIYETLDTYYCGKLSYSSTKHQDDSQSFSILHVSKCSTINTKELNTKINDQIISKFESFFQTGLPVTRVATYEYYLELLEPYRRSKTLFREFYQDVVKCPNLNQHINQVIDSIRDYLKPLLVQFNQNDFKEQHDFVQDSNSTYSSIQTLFKAKNHDKLFISIDINSANFTVIQYFYKDLFKSKQTWKEFVKEFDSKDLFTLQNSKILREKLFGDLGTCKKTRLLSEFFVRKILHDEQIPKEDVVMLNGDEIVINYTSELYELLFQKYHNTFFKVMAFHLVKLPKYEYFVKEHFTNIPSNTEHFITNPNVITQKEIKCVPKNFLCESIKEYEGREVTELDRTYLGDNGRLCLYLKPLYGK